MKKMVWMVLMVIVLLVRVPLGSTSTIVVDGDSGDWNSFYFFESDPEDVTPVGPNENPGGFDITGIWIYYDTYADTLYIRIDTKLIPGDADGDGDPNSSSTCPIPILWCVMDGNTEDPVGPVGEGEQFKITISSTTSLVMRYENNTKYSTGVSNSDWGIAVGDVVEYELLNASQFINPTSFQMMAYAGANGDWVSEDSAPDSGWLQVSLQPSLQITKQGPQTASPGENITYTITYQNTGTGDATNVMITDVVPQYTSYVSSNGSYDSQTKTVSWNLGRLQPGDSGELQLTVRTDFPLDNGTQITNTALLSSDQGSTSSSFTTTIQSSPILTIEKTAPATVDAGDQLTYTITYSNNGDMNATDVVITETYDSNITFVSSNPAPSSGNNVWQIGNLEAGEEGTITVVVQVFSPLPNGTIITNNVKIDSLQTSPVGDSATTTVQSAPDLQITKSAFPTGSVNPGDVITYTLQVSNNGNMNATNVVVTDPIPQNTTILEINNGGHQSGGVITWNLGTLQVSQTKTLSFKVKVNNPVPIGTIIRNSATVTSDQEEDISNETENPVNSSVELEIQKDVDKEVANPGDTLTYVITYKNTGTSAASGVVLVDTLPQNTVFVSASNGGVYDSQNNKVVWNIGMLNPGTYFVELRIQVTEENETVINLATLESNETQPVSDDATTVVEKRVAISINPPTQTKTTKVGQLVKYDFTVTNEGNMQDTISLSTSSIPNGWSATLSTTTLVLSAGASQIVSLTVNPVSANVGDSVKIDVVATSGNDSNVKDSSETVTLIVAPNIQETNNTNSSVKPSTFMQKLQILSVKHNGKVLYEYGKTKDLIKIKPGENLILEITVVNRGILPAHNVKIFVKNQGLSYEVSPEFQDVPGGNKTKTFTLKISSLYVSNPHQSLIFYAEGDETGTGVVNVKIETYYPPQQTQVPTQTPKPQETSTPQTPLPQTQQELKPEEHQPQEIQPEPTPVVRRRKMPDITINLQPVKEGIKNIGERVGEKLKSFAVAAQKYVVLVVASLGMLVLMALLMYLKKVVVSKLPKKSKKGKPGIPGKHRFVIQVGELFK